MPFKTHLPRLGAAWSSQPVWFITTCAFQRKRILANNIAFDILCEEWRSSQSRYGWLIGRFVLMPDHVHFFASPFPDATALSLMVSKWKEWTSKRLKAAGYGTPIWQGSYFDHLLRSSESYEEKWDYVRQNPVRANLVEKFFEWKYRGEISELHEAF